MEYSNPSSLSLPDVLAQFVATANRADWLAERVKASPQIQYWTDSLVAAEQERDYWFGIHNQYLIVMGEFCGMFNRLSK